MPHSLRDATLADIPAITKIYAESVLSGVATYELVAPDAPEMIARYSTITTSGYPYIVAEDEIGTVLGYAYVSAFRMRAAYRFLVEDSIYLAPEAQGRGIGRDLLRELLAQSSALGFRQMIAVIGGAHPASVALHEKAGFQHCGTMKASGYKLDRWLDTVLMQIALGEGEETPPEPDVYPDTLYRG